MKVNVVLSQHTEIDATKGTAKAKADMGHADVTVQIQCGPGEQILRWLAYTACSRLSYIKGDVIGAFVPQAVVNVEGTILDADIVLNELFGEGDTVIVEYSIGPNAFSARWEGRPKTPEFRWGEGGMQTTSDIDWLLEMDLKAHGIDQLIDADLVGANSQALEQDLATTKEVLVQYGGAIQALFKYYESQQDNQDERMMDKMSLSHFRNCMLDARVTTEKFKSEKIDNCFKKALEVQTKNVRKGKGESKTAQLPEFMVALLHVANEKFQMYLEGPNWGYSELSMKLTNLLTQYLFPNIVPGLSERLMALDGALTPATEMLLKKGRRLTEQTLDSCQLKRVVSEERRIDVKYLSTHIRKWGMLDVRFDLCTLTVLVLYAKHHHHEVQKFELKKHPLEVNYDEFERLLLVMAYHMYKAPQGGGAAEEPFEEFLGEVLDDVYKKAGVLVEMKDKKGDE